PCAVRVYPENRAVGAVGASIRGHPVERSPREREGAVRIAPIVYNSAEAVQHLIPGTVHIYLENRAGEHGASPKSHPVEGRPREGEVAMRIGAIEWRSCEAVQHLVPCAVRVYPENCAVAVGVVPNSGSHTVECRPRGREGAQRISPIVCDTAEAVQDGKVVCIGWRSCMGVARQEARYAN